MIIKNDNMKKLSRGEITTHNYRYSCGFRTTRLYVCGEHEEFSTSGVFDI